MCSGLKPEGMRRKIYSTIVCIRCLMTDCDFDWHIKKMKRNILNNTSFKKQIHCNATDLAIILLTGLYLNRLNDSNSKEIGVYSAIKRQRQSPPAVTISNPTPCMASKPPQTLTRLLNP